VVTLPFCPRAPEPAQTSRHCFYGNIWRSEPAAETEWAKCIFPGKSGVGTDMLPNRRSQDIETGWRTWFTPPKSFRQVQTKWLTDYSKEPHVSSRGCRTCKSPSVHAKVQRD
jgi:hypothetical protein